MPILHISHEEIRPDVQSKFPLVQLEAISSCPKMSDSDVLED